MGSRVRIANVQRAIALLIDTGWRMRWSHNNDTLDPAAGITHIARTMRSDVHHGVSNYSRRSQRRAKQRLCRHTLKVVVIREGNEADRPLKEPWTVLICVGSGVELLDWAASHHGLRSEKLMLRCHSSSQEIEKCLKLEALCRKEMLVWVEANPVAKKAVTKHIDDGEFKMRSKKESDLAVADW